MKSYFIPLVTGILLLFVPRVRAGWFEDSHECQGLRDEVTSTCAWGDYDNDGDQELFVGTSNNMGCHLWKKTAIGFEDKALDLGIDFHGVVAASCWGDFNNDGWLDLFIANGSEYDGCFLYQNLGPDRDYSFARVSDLPFNDALAEAKGAVWGDFNNDGILDLFVAYGDYENAGPRDYLYLGDGSNFNDEVWRFDESGIPDDVTATDMDGDGDLDVFVVINSGQCHLFRNQYDPEYPDVINFEDQASPSGVDLRDATSASFADYNYDGKPDLFITGNDPNTGSYLFRNDGSDANRIEFYNATDDEFGINPPIIGNGSAWGDFDLDGDLDLYIIANGMDWLFQNEHREGSIHFMPRDRLTTGLGDDALSLCTEWADFNNDGKPDIFMGNLISQDGDEYFDKLYKNDYSRPLKTGAFR